MMPLMNWWLDDEPFRRAVAARAGPELLRRAEPLLEEMGRLAPEFFAPRAPLADRHRPALERYDRGGRRVDRVVYHPAYREMTEAAYGFGLVRPADEAGPFPQIVKFALGYLFSQGEAGLYCPVCCTDGVARILERFEPGLAERFVPRLTATDPRELLQGAMFMTEKAGGSDLSRIETEARPEGETWRLYGEKWFCSNVDAGLILTIARGPDGPTVFLVPAEVDGVRNRYRIERLKDKMGVASMPTGEVVYEGAFAYRVGEPGDGVRVAAELFNISRIYNAVASVGGAKRALREAVAATRDRVAFGAPVIRQPLAMQDLARLTVELEANMALVLESVRFLDGLDAGEAEDHDRRMLRVLTPIAKLITGKFAVRAASEAMELLGGNGYIEDFDTPRLLRDAQVLPIWEGTTNVLTLDTVRSMAREGTLQAFLTDARRRLPVDGELGAPAKQVSQALDRLEVEAGPVLGGDQHAARGLVERLATAYRAALLIEAGEAGSDRERQVARHYVDGFLLPGMEQGALDLGEGYDDLIGL
jgi:alkylation response protein AidB-like acyl-CoA dehydrogenase